MTSAQFMRGTLLPFVWVQEGEAVANRIALRSNILLLVARGHFRSEQYARGADASLQNGDIVKAVECYLQLLNLNVSGHNITRIL